MSALPTLPLNPAPIPIRTTKDLKAAHHLSSGAASGLASAITLQPLDLLKTRLQQAYATEAKGAKRRKLSQVISGVLKEDGVRGLWRGTTPTIARNVPGVSMYFYSLSAIRGYLTSVPFFAIPLNKPSPIPPTAVAAVTTPSANTALVKLSSQGNLLAGAIGRTAVGFVLNPITVLKARYESSQYNEYKSLISAFKSLLKQNGPKGLFQGFTATAARDAPYAGMYLVFYEKGKDLAGRLIKPEWGIPYAAQHSGSGALAAILATTITSPADVVKVIGTALRVDLISADENAGELYKSPDNTNCDKQDIRSQLRHVRHATTSMRMPAMSPTMTEGGIAGWKKQEGESFAAGDVLLEMETDKATIDVEAQDDGIMGKILVQVGAQKVPVGQVIALLAEEGDDLASIEVPSDLSPPGAAAPPSKADAAAPPEQEKKAEEQESKKAEASSSSTPTAPSGSSDKADHGHKVIKHSKPLFPSVMRLLIDSSLTSAQISKLKGTGRHGMLTKGDVLTALGQISNPYGSAEKLSTDLMGPSGKRASESKATAPATAPPAKEEPLDGPALRRLILAGMSRATQPSTPIIEHSHSTLPLSHDSFDEILSPYASLLPPAQPRVGIPAGAELAAMGRKGSAKADEWAGLY